MAQGPVLEMLLLPHFRQLLEPDPALHPAIKLERCAAITQVQANFLRSSLSTILPGLLNDPVVALPALPDKVALSGREQELRLDAT